MQVYKVLFILGTRTNIYSFLKQDKCSNTEKCISLTDIISMLVYKTLKNIRRIQVKLMYYLIFNVSHTTKQFIFYAYRKLSGVRNLYCVNYKCYLYFLLYLAVLIPLTKQSENRYCQGADEFIRMKNVGTILVTQAKLKFYMLNIKRVDAQTIVIVVTNIDF